MWQNLGVDFSEVEKTFVDDQGCIRHFFELILLGSINMRTAGNIWKMARTTIHHCHTYPLLLKSVSSQPLNFSVVGNS